MLDHAEPYSSVLRFCLCERYDALWFGDKVFWNARPTNLSAGDMAILSVFFGIIPLPSR
jgi:hypothetical protein